MAVLVDILAAGVVDSAGLPLAAGQVYVYEPGTTSKVDIWQDADLSVPHANPLTLDAAGKAEVYINESVRVVIETSAGVSVADIEAVGEVASLEGDVTLGSSSADTVYVNGRIRGDLDPAIPATYQIGDATNTWKDVNLDGGTTNGGAIYFDGGTTEYIKSSADGTELDIGGFTALKLKDECHVIPGTADGTLEIGDGTGTGTDPQLSLNSNSGDATLRLMVNNAVANAWDIRNDNSANDELSFEYNGAQKANINTDGSISVTGDDTTSPVANRLYKANILKAWAHMDCAAGGVTITDDHNISSASYSGSDLTVTIDTDMANATHSAHANFSRAAVVVGCFCKSHAAGTVVIQAYYLADAIGYGWQNSDTVELIIAGNQ